MVRVDNGQTLTYKECASVVEKRGIDMLTKISLQNRLPAIIAIVFGILILAIPSVLQILAGVFLILIGVLFFIRRK